MNNYNAQQLMTEKLVAEKEHMKQELKRGYSSPYSFLLTPSDGETFSSIEYVVQEKLKLKPTLFLLIGIGGSNMGAVAVIEALYGRFYNEMPSNGLRMRFYCADTIDELLSRQLLALVEKELVNNGRVLVCMVSKSGTTVETVVNGTLFFELLKKYFPQDYHNYIVMITDIGSPLEKLGREIQATVLALPPSVGGRFSVFTAVGLFPLMLLGISADTFCKGAQSARTDFFQENNAFQMRTYERVSPYKTAELLFQAYSMGYVIHDIFLFAPELAMLGNWYRQLIGESLGKSHTIDGREIHCGFTPTVSIGMVDLHSVLQLYLAGPANRFTSFIAFDMSVDGSIDTTNNTDCRAFCALDEHTFACDPAPLLTLSLNAISPLMQELPKNGCIAVSSIKHALFSGVLAAYKEVPHRPFVLSTLQERSAYAVGRFMMEKMIETVLLARLFSINPFDQPAVEQYKKYARQALAEL